MCTQQIRTKRIRNLGLRLAALVLTLAMLLPVAGTARFSGAAETAETGATKLVFPLPTSKVWRCSTYEGHGGDNKSAACAIDIRLKNGNSAAGYNVYSVADGVVYDDAYKESNGQVTIKHTVTLVTINCTRYTSWYSTYAHMTNISVSKGDKVTAGQVIGKVGSVGNSTGPHLHYSMSNAMGGIGRYQTATTDHSISPYYVYGFVNADGSSASYLSRDMEGPAVTQWLINFKPRSSAAVIHSWNGGTVTTQPTCTATGVCKYTCITCKTTKNQTLVASGHSYADGNCIRCGAEDPDYADNVPKYEISDSSGTAGSTVDVYVSVDNNPGIISLRHTVTYDTTALELISVEDCGLLAGYTTPSATITSPYTLRWADSLAAANNTSNGQFVKLTFRILDTAEAGSYSISVNHVEARDIDGTKLTFNNASAIVSVVEYLCGDADGDNEITDWDGILLSRYLAGWSVDIESLSAMDTDGDGEITDWDGVLLDRYLAGWTVNSGIGK